jgi:hypothetical protein
MAVFEAVLPSFFKGLSAVPPRALRINPEKGGLEGQEDVLKELRELNALDIELYE